MASPQKEHGYTAVANELEEQFYSRAFTAREHAILGWVRRHTYGYNGRKEAPYTTRAIADATGIKIAHVRETIARLTEAHVLVAHEGRIGIQKDHDRWGVPSRTRSNSDPQRIQNGSPKRIRFGSPARSKTDPQKDPNQIPTRSESDPLTPSSSANDDDREAPKTTIKQEKQGMAMSVPGTFSAFLEGITWGEGEADFWLGVFGYSRIGDLALLAGTTREQFKDILRFSLEARANAIAYLRAVTATGKAINKPLGYVLGYLQDPAKYPVLEAPKVVQIAEAKAAKVDWFEEWCKGRGTHSDRSWATAKIGMEFNRAGLQIPTRNEVEQMCAEVGLRATFEHYRRILIEDWRRKKAAGEG